MVDASDGWAVGFNGAILHYSSGSWALVPSPTSNNLRSIFMLSSSDGWAAGDGGTILRDQGGLWVNYPSPTTSQLNSLYLSDASHGWAVGASGTILHFDGSVWTTVPDSATNNLNSVTQMNSQQAWAVGDSATILQWTGFSWNQYTPAPPLSDSPSLNSIYTLPNGFGFIVGAPAAPGSQGTVLQAPSMSPIPEAGTPQLLLWAMLTMTMAISAIVRRRTSSSKRQQ